MPLEVVMRHEINSALENLIAQLRTMIRVVRWNAQPNKHSLSPIARRSGRFDLLSLLETPYCLSLVTRALAGLRKPTMQMQAIYATRPSAAPVAHPQAIKRCEKTMQGKSLSK
jgi:hypothetical protein